MLPWQLVVNTRNLCPASYCFWLFNQTILTDLNYKYAKKTMDNILDDVSLKWFNASEGEKYAGKRIIIMFMATLEKWIEFLGRVKGSTSHGTNLTLMSKSDIFCAIWHLVLSHVTFDAWTSPASKLSNYGKPGETRDNAPCTRMWVSRLPQMESMLAGYLTRAFDEDPLSSAEAPAGYPNTNSNNRKIESARVRWEEGKGGSLCHIMHSRWRRISEEDWN